MTASPTRRNADACASVIRARKAFTLVELLVVIAIVGVLVGLLLPAVQFAREAARQTTCRNHLKQIGLAIHAYHGTHRALPVGCVDSRVVSRSLRSKNYAWSALLLPFIEQQPLHESIDFGIPFDHANNADAASKQLAIYLCPTVTPQYSVRGPTHYGGLYGETLVDPANDDGLFLYNRRLAFRDCGDGLSHTMAVSEDVIGPHGEWINGNNIFVQSHGINDETAWIFDNEIRSLHPAGAMALFIDGSVHIVNESLDRKLLGAMITRNGHEVLEQGDL
ncbi:hypothetical protein Poly51_40680 [Rubripirellula tenax]|uniref:DUF1559 domain-containing protein n=1 Tax=Rubripirellula tenax TaxID=2528015 RepID=A0A5C6EQ72_9BACT|nr:DUF1559 domain-containing protein [Rubripirellula tenax]TWU50775.1 hypothetical protein Poly51_40680 [Rubripirellula tenax]